MSLENNASTTPATPKWIRKPDFDAITAYGCWDTMKQMLGDKCEFKDLH